MGGVEEVQANDLFGALCGGGDGTDAQTGGVAGEDGMGGGQAVEVAEDLSLQLQLLRHGLDDQSDAGRLFQLRGGRD